jgi:hypothetical protein
MPVMQLLADPCWLRSRPRKKLARLRQAYGAHFRSRSESGGEGS